MEIKVQGSMTRMDILEVFKTHLTPSRQSNWIRLGLSVVLLAVMIYVMYQGVGTMRTYLLGILVMIGIVNPWWLPYLQVTGINKKNPLLKPISGVVNEEGMQLSGEQFNSNMNWSSFSNYKVGNCVVLLYQGKNEFNFLSAGLFSRAGDWEACLRLIEMHLKPVEIANKK